MIFTEEQRDALETVIHWSERELESFRTLFSAVDPKKASLTREHMKQFLQRRGEIINQAKEFYLREEEMELSQTLLNTMETLRLHAKSAFLDARNQYLTDTKKIWIVERHFTVFEKMMEQIQGELET